MPNLAQLRHEIETADSALKMTDAVRALADAHLLETVPDLMAALGYNNPGAAVAAVDGLIAIGEPAVEPLLGLIDDYNYGARAWAVRALAGIGDPRGLDVLLDTAPNDFALSVRRAAARGLGFLQWERFPSREQAESAQQRCAEVLIQVCQDPEWVVRYAAVTGLEGLAIALPKFVDAAVLDARLQTIQACLEALQQQDPELGIKIRVKLALQRIAGQ